MEKQSVALLKTSAVKYALLLPLLAFFYIALGKLSLGFATMPEGIAVVWFPNGLLLALFLLRPYKEWIWYILMVIPAELIADIPQFSVSQALQFACVNLGETLSSAYLLRKIAGSERSFHNTQYVLFFIIIALALVPSISAIFGALIYHTQIETQTDFMAFWRIWFFGDSLGILLLTPLIVSWFDTSRKLFISKHYLSETLLTNALIILLSIAIFAQSFNASILPTTPIIFILLSLWVVYRQGLRLSMVLGFFIGLIGVYFTVNHQGPFSVFDAVQNTLYLQEFIAAMMTSILFFGVLLRQINDKNEEILEVNKALHTLTSELEKRVDEKTEALQKANAKLQELVTKDALTGIYNRYYFQHYLTQEVARASRHNYSLSIILFDIDYFKKINDTYGHQAGDEVLISLSQAILKRLRMEDIFARIGGEEFIIILSHIDGERAKCLAEEIRALVASLSIKTQTYEIRCTISLGVSSLGKRINSFESLFADADSKLYQAKELGRNRVI